MRNLLYEMGFTAPGPSMLRVDNQSAISVAKHPEHHGRMKQLDLSWYWLHDVVHKEIIAPVFVPTNDQPADILTNALAQPKVELFCGMLGLGRRGGSWELETCTIRWECWLLMTEHVIEVIEVYY